MIYAIIDTRSFKCIKYFFKEDKAEEYVSTKPYLEIMVVHMLDLLTDEYNRR